MAPLPCIHVCHKTQTPQIGPQTQPGWSGRTCMTEIRRQAMQEQPSGSAGQRHVRASVAHPVAAISTTEAFSNVQACAELPKHRSRRLVEAVKVAIIAAGPDPPRCDGWRGNYSVANVVGPFFARAGVVDVVVASKNRIVSVGCELRCEVACRAWECGWFASIRCAEWMILLEV